MTPEKKKKLMWAGGIIIGLLLVGFIIWALFFRTKKPANHEAIQKKVAGYKANGGGVYREMNQSEWDGFAQWIKDNYCPNDSEQGTTYKDCPVKYYEQILGFFKAYDIQPGGWQARMFENEIKAWVADGGAERGLIIQGELA